MKIKLSLSALLLSSTIAMAGGDISAVEPQITIPEIKAPTVSTSGFYAGLGYSCMQLVTDTPDEEFMGNGVSINVGYNVNPFLAVEARYTRSLDDVNYKTWNVDQDLEDSSLSNAAIYLKPKFSIAGFGMYGLVGYGQTELDNGTNTFTESGFQYGIGTNFTVMDTEFFVDYRRLYDAEDFDSGYAGQDVATNSFTLGVNYNF
ncbi:MAG: porin family protein [Campylobacterota bacterium]|nr:porin family protein [Campylobacterota bacterium]